MAITYNDVDSDLNVILQATSGGTVFSANLATTTVFDYFSDTPAVNDAIYFGGYGATYYFTFSNLKFNIGTAMAGTDIVLAWEYYSQTGLWLPLHNMTDNTAGFTATGAQTLVFPIQSGMYYGNISSYSTRTWVRCRLVSFTTVTEGGAQQTSKVQCNKGLITVSGYTEGSPCTYEILYQWLLANAPEVAATRETVAGSLNAKLYRFPNCDLTIASPLTTTNEIIILGNDAVYLNNALYYIRSGTLQARGFTSPSFHFTSNQGTGSGGMTLNYNSKVYGGVLGKWGYSKRGQISAGGATLIGVTLGWGLSPYNAPVIIENCILQQSLALSNDIAPIKKVQFIDTSGYGYIVDFQTALTVPANLKTRIDDFYLGTTICVLDIYKL